MPPESNLGPGGPPGRGLWVILNMFNLPYSMADVVIGFIGRQMITVLGVVICLS